MSSDPEVCDGMRDSKETQGAPEKPESGGEPQNPQQPPEGHDSKNPPVYKRPLVILSAIVLLIIVLGGAFLYWRHSRQYASTDDAYIDGPVTQISSQVPGPIAALHVDDNQFVHQGDLLVEIEPTDYKVALEQAEAKVLSAQGKLAQTQAEIGAARAAVRQAEAQIESAQVALDNATRDLNRYQAVPAQARSQQQLDNATAARQSAKANFARAQAQKTSTEANVATAEAAIKAAEGEVAVARAGVRRAEVNLADCRIVAPSDGRVAQRTIEPGTYVQAGQTMFMLVSPNVWVTANFKETQLKHMRPGQPVRIKVDAYPDVEFDGRVDSIQPGSGARFSVLPAENASGNFVKIVQRVPVKITFEHGSNTNNARLLAPGLSVEPKVKVR